MAFVILFLPTINESYFILYDLTSILYLLMYILLFAAFIRLRFKEKNRHRPYSVPFGNIGVWLFGGTGFLCVCFLLVMAFFPSTEVKISSVAFYEFFLFLGVFFLAVVPFIWHKVRHKKWHADWVEEKNRQTNIL